MRGLSVKPLEKLPLPRLGGIPTGMKSKKLLPMRKPLQTLADAPDPIEDKVAYTDDLATDAALELDAVAIGFRERMKEEAARQKGATDSGFYFCVVFDDGAQASAFLKGVGFPPGSDLFVDGRVLADMLNIPIPASEAALKPRLGKIDQKLVRLTGIPKK
jgi:hypothetical protein